MAAESPKRRVLVLEDNLDDALEAERALHGLKGFDFERVTSVRAAEHAVAGESFDLVVVDYRLPDGSGIAFCRKLRASGFRAPVFVVTSVGSDAIAKEALEAGADDLIVKSDGYGDVLAAAALRAAGGRGR